MLTTSELAAAVGVTPRRLLAIAKRRGVKPAKRHGRYALWDCGPDALRPGVQGWPKGTPRPARR